MKPFVIAAILAAAFAQGLHAQTFLQHLQQKETGKGTVTVVQSHDIDELVNHADVSGHRPATVPAAPAKSPATAHENSGARHTAAPRSSAAETPAHRDGKTANNKKEEHPASRNNITRHEPAETHSHANRTEPAETETAVVDMRRKMPRRSYKINGYRVQVLAGGNNRDGMQKVQQAGNDVKMAFPDLPVYVHFYSPRWICRVGNFRTYEEANRVLQQLKKMGFRQACIVSGKITVAY